MGRPALRGVAGTRIGDFMMTKMMMRASLGALALAVSAGAASAQTEELISNPRGMVTNFDVVNIGPVLTELGVVWQERQLADGRVFIAASIGATLSFNIVPAACLGADGKSNCVGANLITLFTGGSPNSHSGSAADQEKLFTNPRVDSAGNGA